MIELQCPTCQQTFTTNPAEAGTTANCPACGTLVDSSGSSSTPAEPATMENEIEVEPAILPVASPDLRSQHPAPGLPAGGAKSSSNPVEASVDAFIRICQRCIDFVQRLLGSEKTRDALEKAHQGAASIGKSTVAAAKAVATSEAAKTSVRKAKEAAGQLRKKASRIGHSAPVPEPTGQSTPEAAQQPADAIPTAATANAGTVAPVAKRKFDWRFPIGILVALGCTALIVVAIIGSRNPPSGYSSPASSGSVDYRPPCERCRGSGQLVGQCRKCFGAGTIMTGNANYDGIEVPTTRMQIPCPQCRGSGQMPVPCTRCAGSGKGM